MAPHAESPTSIETHIPTTKDDILFLEDLNNYIPLGCLHLIEKTNLEILYLNPNKKIIRDYAASLVLYNHDVPLGSSVPITTAFAKLIEHGWIRVSCPSGMQKGDTTVIRIHLLPHDVGRRYVRRESKDLQSALQILLPEIDISPISWSGGSCNPLKNADYFDPWPIAEDCSLFYLFNTLPSPMPDLDLVSDRYARYAVRQLLDPDGQIPGLKTKLYPYQARSAAMMIQREATVHLQLDPRLELRIAPNGQGYYFDARQAFFLQNARYYDSNRGGILAETMGLGKTIICLAVILATKHHLPRIPQQYARRSKSRSHTASLRNMAAAALQGASVPSRSFFTKVFAETGQDMSECLRAIDEEPAEYFIPGRPLRIRRQAGNAPPTRMRLCSGTIIVVPRNLVHQWKAELQKHVTDNEFGLRVLIMDSGKKLLPSAEELIRYDIILFSRTRFEQEVRDGSDSRGRRRATGATPLICACPYIGSTRMPDCHCLKDEDLYRSPIKDLHWLRIIIDEGHEFSSSNSIAVTVSNTLVTAERRWVVSGTPARDRLFGVEVDLAVNDDLSIIQSLSADDNESSLSSRDLALEQRRNFDAKEESTGAARSIGLLASHFLQVKPWAEASGDIRVEWDDYIFRHEDLRRRTYSAFSSCLRRTMESLIVKTQPEDVERDIILPPLEHRVVYLEPSFYDKAIFNLFVLFLTANAITSEREDKDYLFHRDSTRARGHLLANLRQSSFFWTGFTEKDIESAIGHSESYLGKLENEIKCTDQDRALLSKCLEFAHMLLSIESWKALSKTHEIGLFVENWPADSQKEWNMSGNEDSLMSGVTQLLQAQTFVNGNLSSPEPTEGLATLGKAAIIQAYEVAEEKPKKANASHRGQSDSVILGVPASGLNSETSSIKQHYAVSTGKPGMVKKSPKKERKEEIEKTTTLDKSKQTRNSASHNDMQDAGSNLLSQLTPMKRRKSMIVKAGLPEESPLRKTSIIGTTSAKLSYLIDKIVALHTQEKILVFYDGENTAYYVAQFLELLHIKHLIYAKSLNLEFKSRYIVTFDQDDSVRVLLMDIRCGALGLNVNKASRVFFINPCNRPSIEAQAIKRAHRIGQNKPVYVETLILKGTVEERIFERSKAMTRTEHVETRILEDDMEVANIIKNAKPLPLRAEDAQGVLPMARLQAPQELFGRANRDNAHIKGIDKEKDEAHHLEGPTSKRSRSSKKTALPRTPPAQSNPESPQRLSSGTVIAMPLRSPTSQRSIVNKLAEISATGGALSMSFLEPSSQHNPGSERILDTSISHSLFGGGD